MSKQAPGKSDRVGLSLMELFEKFPTEEDKKGTLLNYWNKSPSFLFLTDQNGETDAFPSASANSQTQTPRFVLKTRPNRCTKQFPQSYPGFSLRFSSLSRRRHNRQTE